MPYEFAYLKGQLCFWSRSAKNNPEIPKKEISETSKREKLAKLAGFELEMKKDLLVPKHTIFSLWLNDARSKT
jgi:hypothetical protein